MVKVCVQHTPYCATIHYLTHTTHQKSQTHTDTSALGYKLVKSGHHTEPVAAAKLTYMRQESLAVGGHFTIQFDPLPEPFLPSDVARDLSVSTGQQADLLRTLSVSPGSLLAAVMNQTVESCSLAPLPNERKRCVTTLDDMLQFLQLAFGNDQVSVYKTWKDNSHIPGVLETFTVASVRELPCSTSLAPVLCHPRIFPYGVYYCHTITGTRVLEVAMYNEAAPATGDPSVKGIVVCHDDTSNFPVDHISFKVLGLQPGDRICHWHNMHGLVFCDTKDVKSS